jgi:hypothetical protein
VYVVDAGLYFAVAAGNDNRDARNYSPAAALTEKAVTVVHRLSVMPIFQLW